MRKLEIYLKLTILYLPISSTDAKKNLDPKSGKINGKRPISQYKLNYRLQRKIKSIKHLISDMKKKGK